MHTLNRRGLCISLMLMLSSIPLCLLGEVVSCEQLEYFSIIPLLLGGILYRGFMRCPHCDAFLRHWVNPFGKKAGFCHACGKELTFDR